MANRAAGKGYENEDYYTNIKLQFIGIENIHVMRNSQQKIIDGKSWSVCECVCVSGSWLRRQIIDFYSYSLWEFKKPSGSALCRIVITRWLLVALVWGEFCVI